MNNLFLLLEKKRTIWWERKGGEGGDVINGNEYVHLLDTVLDAKCNIYVVPPPCLSESKISSVSDKGAEGVSRVWEFSDG